MDAEQAPSFEAPSLLNLPPDLLIALDRHQPQRKIDMRLDGWRSRSFLRRLLERLFGRSSA